jgi:protein-S-isoprenylcysteine O-methyltransferase Ste14
MSPWQHLFANLQLFLWLAWVFYWKISSFGVKAVTRRESIVQRLSHFLPLWVAIILFWLPAPSPWSETVFHRGLPLSLLGILLVMAGLFFSVWARLVLAGNWSATVTIKRDHELIQTGPYRWVRHPIYSGLLIAVLGTVLIQDRWLGLVSLALVSLAFWFKLRREEAWMMEVFGERYARYRAHTARLFPYLF